MGDQNHGLENRSLLEKFISNKGAPPTICIELSKLCNLSCSYCRSESSPLQKKVIDFDSLSQFLVKVRQVGDWRISLTGGEPTLWKHLLKLVKLINHLGFNYCITTNGFSSQNFFSKLSLEHLKKATVKVSLDGNRMVHNSLRGKNCFENAIAFINRFQDKFPRIVINTTLIQHPKHWAGELCAELKRLKISQWTIISPVSTNKWTAGHHINYRNQYDFIENIYKINMCDFKLSFLDYNSLDEQTVVYVSSDGKVLVPYGDAYQNNALNINTNGIEDIIMSTVVSVLKKGILLQ